MVFPPLDQNKVTMHLVSIDWLSIYCDCSVLYQQAGTGVLKILNPILYKPSLPDITTKLLRDCNIQVLNISRLDLCADFNNFEGYPDMQDFFQDFLTLKLWKIGAAKYKVCANKATEFDCDYFKLIGLQSSRHTYQ